MTDIVDRLQAAMHMESAAIAPQTSEAIEAMRDAQEVIERLRAALKAALDCWNNGPKEILLDGTVKELADARKVLGAYEQKAIEP